MDSRWTPIHCRRRWKSRTSISMTARSRACVIANCPFSVCNIIRRQRPGPHDASYFFSQFAELIDASSATFRGGAWIVLFRRAWRRSLFHRNHRKRTVTITARAQGHDLTEHPNAVVQEADFASFAMVPVHRNLSHSEFRAPRQVKQFDVEAKSVGLRLIENRPANIEAERLKAALRIPKRETGRNAYDQIENAPALFTPPRLTIADQPPVQRPRPKRNIHLTGRMGPISLGASSMGVDKSASEKNPIGRSRPADQPAPPRLFRDSESVRSTGF